MAHNDLTDEFVLLVTTRALSMWRERSIHSPAQSGSRAGSGVQVSCSHFACIPPAWSIPPAWTALRGFAEIVILHS